MEYTDMPANLQDEKAKRLYTALCEEYLRTHGVEEIPDSSMALLTDIATMEQIKSKLLKEIETARWITFGTVGRSTGSRTEQSARSTALSAHSGATLPN